MDILKKIDNYLTEEERTDESAAFMDVAQAIQDFNAAASSGKVRRDAIKKLHMKIMNSRLSKKVKDALIDGFLKGFKKTSKW